jgi:hypothetical protein
MALSRVTATRTAKRPYSSLSVSYTTSNTALTHRLSRPNAPLTSEPRHAARASDWLLRVSATTEIAWKKLFPCLVGPRPPCGRLRMQIIRTPRPRLRSPTGLQQPCRYHQRSQDYRLGRTYYGHVQNLHSSPSLSQETLAAAYSLIPTLS